MVNESLTTRLARERLAALNRFIPLRDRVRNKLQTRQEMQTDFNIGSEQLFAPVTSATRDVKAAAERAIYGDISEEEKKKKAPLLSILESVAAETRQAKESLKALPSKMITAQQLQRQREQQEKKTIKQLGEIDIDDSPPRPTSPIVTFEEEEEEEQGATARKPEEEIIQGEEEQQDISSSRGKGRIPSLILTKASRDEIRGYQKDELIDFTAKNFKKKLRDEYIFNGRENRITKLEDWTRIVFLTSKYKDSLSAGDGYKNFHQAVKNKKDELEKKGTTQSYTAAGYSGSGLVGNSSSFNASVTCPANILSDISRLEVLIGGKRAGNNSPEIINEAADICRRLFTGGIMDIHVYRELIDELADD